MIDRSTLSPSAAYLVLDESEADGCGAIVPTTTIFLTASQCPVGCHMCDLHQNTLLTATPRGAIVQQIDKALLHRPRRGWIKLYNSGNFFDPRSIPPDDYAEIAKRCEGFSKVVVENHPKFGVERLRRFQSMVSSPLEVAVGLETVQPRWLHRLGKQMSRDDFDQYARFLASLQVDLRVFLIVGVPGSSVAEAIRWSRLSVRHAIAQGARHISLIPARSGHGWNGQADQLPEITLNALLDLQQQAMQDCAGQAVVTVDLWDLDASHKMVQQLSANNLSQQATVSDL